ncbi:hypothetical protein THAOC_19186 [Thalassiosira oceanica]|uniref:Uncharacterized protein n=1 Tax=Thalassiosira oceanica TaxID=159749 RepID=K0S6C3_THAOC|nr:hypothetical protein THAOC_19186 [Thalassiosira oceanica]|eukprot:EJK60459.1 hypothetical protein THAOC_19186 [Thalassiosira oceanica]
MNRSAPVSAAKRCVSLKKGPGASPTAADDRRRHMPPAADDRGRVMCLKMRYNSSVCRDLIFNIQKASRSDRNANNGLNDRLCLCVVWIAARAAPNDASRRGGQVSGAQRIKRGANLGLSLLKFTPCKLVASQLATPTPNFYSTKPFIGGPVPIAGRRTEAVKDDMKAC